jgi:hypothetical protein
MMFIRHCTLLTFKIYCIYTYDEVLDNNVLLYYYNLYNPTPNALKQGFYILMG